MSVNLCLSIRFLDPAFHGRYDGGEPEWPPSPLRVFQALVAAASARWFVEQDDIFPAAKEALTWLEQQSAPTIISPLAKKAIGYGLYVPNNAMDIVARAWCRGNDSGSGDADPSTHKTMKMIRPYLLQDDNALCYLWPMEEPLASDIRAHIEVLSEISHSVVSLGWGIDMAIANSLVLSDEEVESLPGERWRPSPISGNDGLRVPVKGTLIALIRRHHQFLNRIGHDGFIPPESLSCYAIATYRRVSSLPLRPVAGFSLQQLDTSAFRAFDTARSGLTVAGMMRFATELAAIKAGWAKSRINSFVLGHGEARGNKGHIPVGPQRFAFLPLPSIESRGGGRASVVGSIRRAIVTVFGGGCEKEMDWARRILSGQEIIDEREKRPVAVISYMANDDKVIQYYTRPANTWATVTPVILPGFDDPAHYRRRLNHGVKPDEQKILLSRLDVRIDTLLRKAIIQACFPKDLADHAKLDWQKIGYWLGVRHVGQYGVPDHLKRFPLYHVKIEWRDSSGRPIQIPGPVCIGGGRYMGLGLFAASRE